MKYIRTKDGRIINVSDNWTAHFSKNGGEYTLESYTANWNALMGVLEVNACGIETGFFGR